MPFQTTVNQFSGAGVIGELFDNGPVRCQPYTLVSTDAAQNVIGRGCTLNGTTTSGLNIATAQIGNNGGTYWGVGILVNPKVYASYGPVGGNPLDPTLTLANNTQVEILSMGSIWVTFSTVTHNVGDPVFFDNTTGVLTTVPRGGTQLANTTFANAYVDRFNINTGLAVITLNPAIPAYTAV